MTQKRIAIFVDHKTRDLAGLVYLKYILTEQFNYRVLLAPIDSSNIISVFLPHLILLPHSRLITRESLLMKKARKMGSFVASLPTEGIVKNEEVGAYVAGKYAHPNNVPDINFVWGQGMLDIMEKHECPFLNKTVVSGNPRFDFYSPPLSSLFPAKTDLCLKYGITPDRPIILWATSYPFANRDITEVQIEMKKSNVYKALDVNEFLEYTNLSQKLSLDIFFKLAAQRKDVNFILKPHPFERLNQNNIYTNYIAESKLDNVYFIDSEPVANLLNICDILLHLSSTTSLEAWLLGKQTISLEFVEREADSHLELLSGGEVVKNYEELVETVQQYLKTPEISKPELTARQKFITKWINKADGKSTQRCAKIIDDYLVNNSNNPRILPLQIIKYFINIIIKISLDTFHYIFGMMHGREQRQTYKLNRAFYKNKKFTKKEIEDLENQIKSVITDKSVIINKSVD